jgi:hypothetical protein
LIKILKGLLQRILVQVLGNGHFKACILQLIGNRASVPQGNVKRCAEVRIFSIADDQGNSLLLGGQCGSRAERNKKDQSPCEAI